MSALPAKAPTFPILRAGQRYDSLQQIELKHHATGATLGHVSLANSGLISRDLARLDHAHEALAGLSVTELIAQCRRAAELFATAELPLGEGTQSAQDYAEQLSATTGFPLSLVRRNMTKLTDVLSGIENVLAGLTRNLDLTALDSPHGKDGQSYRAETDGLGVILPSNSPGVHGLWLPCIPLKIPLVLKPGRSEPWTPWRMAEAFMAAGTPREAFSIYPTDHAGATTIMLATRRSMLFGDSSTLNAWRHDARVQLHGPGYSKLVLDAANSETSQHLDLIISSALANGGRSCLNASGLRVAARGREHAAELADRFAAVEALSLDHPEAQLAAFSDPGIARAVSKWLDRQLEQGGVEDMTATRRGPRLVEVDGSTFLLPTVVWCSNPQHPLAQTELLFPFMSVVQVPEEQLVSELPESLVVTALVANPKLQQALLASPAINRLNLGSIPTWRISWDQPHEGNLFEHLYRHRALQISPASD